MKITGFANLFVKKTKKDDKEYTFFQASISGKNEKDEYINKYVDVYFTKDSEIASEDLDEGICYKVNLTDATLAVKYDGFKKEAVFVIYIKDLDFNDEVKFERKQKAPQTNQHKKSPKNK